MIKVLTIDSECNSAQKLGFETYVYNYDRIEKYDNDIVIRWGNSSSFYDKDGKIKEFKNVLNKGENIRLNCEKNKSLKKISEVVKTPKIYYGNVPKNKLVVYRNVWHSNGDGFKVEKGPFKIKTKHYATQWIKTNKEYRVWYCKNNGGQFIMARRVTYNKQRLKEKYPCRSKYCYIFFKKVPNNLKKQVKLAFDKLNLEFGATDILYKNGKYYFLETNTSPTIDSPEIENFYKNNLPKLVKEKFPVIEI